MLMKNIYIKKSSLNKEEIIVETANDLNKNLVIEKKIDDDRRVKSIYASNSHVIRRQLRNELTNLR